MAPTCFGLRPSSVSLQLSLAKIILILKHSLKLRRNLLCERATYIHNRLEYAAIALATHISTNTVEPY